jgi:hypothetical protein
MLEMPTSVRTVDWPYRHTAIVPHPCDPHNYRTFITAAGPVGSICLQPHEPAVLPMVRGLIISGSPSRVAAGSTKQEASAFEMFD